MKIVSLLLATLIGLTSASPIHFQRQDQQLCNANADLCSRKYSNVSYIGTHDSAFVGPTSDPRVNQELSVTDQLDAGIRFLQAQTHKDALGTLSMCHTSCWLLYAGSLVDYLTTIKSWMDANPDAVLTLLLTNGDSVDVSEFGSAMQSSSLKDYAFVPSANPLGIDDWPTLGDLVNANTRLVVFLDYGADASSVPYILDEFAYFFETPYDTTDPTFNECTINRPPGASADGRMYIVNHFLDQEVAGIDSVLVPDNGADAQTNAATGVGSIGAQVDLCTGTYGRVPNFVLLDMFDRGDWLAAQHAMNFPQGS